MDYIKLSFRFVSSVAGGETESTIPPPSPRPRYERMRIIM